MVLLHAHLFNVHYIIDSMIGLGFSLRIIISKIEILNSTLKSSGGIYFCMSSVYLCISWWYDLPVLLTAVEGEYHEQIHTGKSETSYP